MTNKNIKKAHVGTTPVKAVYLGSTKVYPTIANGVYILDVDNNLFKKDKWDIENNSKAMGVAVITDNCAFCISIFEDPSYYTFTKSGYTIEEYPNIVTTQDEQTALKDFNGDTNTGTMTDGDTDRKYEAMLGAFIEWPNGVTEGYVGALGEWSELYQHITEVNECLTLLEGNEVDKVHWTSTLVDTERVWCFVGNINFPHLFRGEIVYVEDALAIRSFYPIDLSTVTVVQ